MIYHIQASAVAVLALLVHGMRLGLAPSQCPARPINLPIYTDRPNLSKVIRAAESDREIARYLDALHSGDTEEAVALYRDE